MIAYFFIPHRGSQFINVLHVNGKYVIHEDLQIGRIYSFKNKMLKFVSYTLESYKDDYTTQIRKIYKVKILDRLPEITKPCIFANKIQILKDLK